mmetsp:Transcript_29274/g.41448  ORF Transcript_29274/g.41448 Transcript_29274/m.41448 type:complete len:465 (+) Transcript_29274:192-1586(+)|eukprot:CAMPEP_0202442624 /NCGR_PEP_ID=MMETSP1360-20130828/2020_1 /ASSEMBLY_ACC=CAM_ASM_000848 /TAXON_ID=515479 /ORGANISM="Licmophora paradoxa, Strain CCMP2313" /LENGTH=464 /DNA_ID=CAMNT_0049058041 /DNA_START=200 /DNA_END=1594 /DNA_ORIENTATION=-
MKLLFSSLLMAGLSEAFIIPQQTQRFTSSPLFISSAGRTKDEIDLELSSGRLMEGGHVIDFSAVKGESRAEAALAQARRQVLSNPDGVASVGSTGIIGINDEVIKEVGHDLGSFVDAQTVQNIASYMRYKAPLGYFAGQETITPFSQTQVQQFESILRKAYVESGEVTSAFAKTFYLGTQLLPEDAREAIWAIYVWCRRTDEIVDAPRQNDDEMLPELSTWEIRLENLWEKGAVEDVFDLCLLDVRIKYPNLPITPFVDMIRGMLMDVPDLGQDRYESFDELHLYCYRVAGTVGLMSMPIFGCAKGYNEDVAREPALSLGVAFQLTNILRDVGEDAAQRGRIYLPRDDMERFGVTEEQIMARRIDDNYRQMMKFQIERARKYYDRARRGVFMLAEESRLPVQSSLDAYGKILTKIEENGYDSLNTRAYVGKWEKLSIIPFSWYRTQEISKALALPGDRPFEETI